ncbi:Suppressyn [Frankliniella fusca]|uniref:Suppressyn n=1 Tax=Frankliniella fusca TaxID=407009 RepID=A0AAE1HZJ4_9NEOP|nr:Suppressyn [Frankliniella fusca]
MPLAATVKNHMLRLLRRSKSTRSPSPVPAAMVIPNKGLSSPPVIVEPLPMTLGSAAPPAARHSHSSQHHQQRQGHGHHQHNGGPPAARSRSVCTRREVAHRPSGRRARVQGRALCGRLQRAQQPLQPIRNGL